MSLTKLSKWVLRGALLLFVFVTIVFLWGEKICPECGFDINKITSYFESVGALATSFTLLFLYFQLKINQEQILANVLPDLFLSETSIELKVFAETPLDGEKEFYILPKNFLDNQSKIKITNFGLGIAINVSYEWIFNQSEIDAFVTNNEITAKVPGDNNKSDIGNLHKDKESYIDLPFRYLMCCDQTTNLLALIGEADKYRNKPDLKIILKYSDIHKTSFSKTFTVAVTGISEDVKFEFMEKKSTKGFA